MIGHFPTPRPNELVYSICARYSSRVGYPNVKSVLHELFGASTASSITDLPNRLGHLVVAIPAGSSLTVEHLINQHTLLPYFGAFLPPERVKQIRKDMQISSGPAAHMRSGIMGSRIPMPEYLRFCPLCKQENEEKYGEIYWHRLHQLSGVEVCPIHQVFIENSNACIRAGRRNLLFISADKATRDLPVCHIDSSNKDHQKLLKISLDAEWLLEHPSPGTSLKALHNRYLRLLIGRELATYTGSIHVKKLLKEFDSYYSPALLKLLHCELKGSNLEKSNWLLRMVRGSKYSTHPIYHLLLMHFLGCTVERFFQLPEELNFFGEGPWPCLNPVAAHHMQQVIAKCQLGKRLRNNNPVGIFSCECGFSYARTGPDASPEDIFRISKMISFGLIWQAKLKELWKDSTLSLSELGRQLGVDPLTVRRHAARLKLPFSRSGRRAKQLNPSMKLKGNSNSVAWQKKRRTCRSKWLSVMKLNPRITMKAMRHKLPREYAWLRQNDFQWLKRHRPRPKKRIQITSSVDWKRRDAEYAAAVRATASRLKNALGRPVQVTKTAIARAIGAVTLLQQKLHKMPVTARILFSVVETREEYAIRRVFWAADRYVQENILPLRWQLIIRSNVYKLKETQPVKSAIDTAMNRLEINLSPELPVKVQFAAL